MAFDFQITTSTVWMEARGEPIEGIYAVAYVIANRLRHGGFGKSLTAVCLAPHQFSCWNSSDPNRAALAAADPGDKALLQSETAVMAVLNKTAEDPTHGGLYYVQTSILPQAWLDGMTKTAEIGKHTFFK